MKPNRWGDDESGAASVRRSSYSLAILRWAAIFAVVIFVMLHILAIAIAPAVVRQAFFVEPEFLGQFIIHRVPAFLLWAGTYGALAGAAVGAIVERARRRKRGDEP